MLTKKEKLYIRPWIQKHFNNHREKIKNARPAIDFNAPNVHPHIALKLKKAQREHERKMDIEKENIRLLRSLGEIMNKKRLANFWLQPRPNFLNRELLYKSRPATGKLRMAHAELDVAVTSAKEIRGASAVRCNACSGRPTTKNNQVRC